MLDLTNLVLFAGACVVLTATPGPDMLLIASRTAAQGRLAGFATLAGSQVGTYLHAAAAALGLTQLLILVPTAYDAIRFAGALYLLYLAWTTLRSAHTANLAAVAPSAAKTSIGRIFRQGLITNVLNPKMALFVLALFPQFVRPEAGAVGLQIMLLATVLNVIGVIVNGTVIMAVSRIGGLITSRSGDIARWPSYLLSAVFTGLALRLALASRT
jgi:threonine/homoserine/homoserine lactone efflux protein